MALGSLMDSAASPLNFEITERLLTVISKEGMVDRDKLSMDASLDTLGVISADVVVILLAIEEEFGVYIPVDSELSETKTVGDLVAVLASHIKAAQAPT
jgi:acyl carrier protein